MRTSKEGIDLITSMEGCVLHPYRDAVGVWTIGYGHTGPGVQRMGPITLQKARMLLHDDLRTFELAVEHNVRVPLSQRQFDALVSFTYNLGAGTLQRSSVRSELNVHHYAVAANRMLLYNRAGGQVLKGLVRRRRAERRLFLRGSALKTRIRARLYLHHR